MSSGSALKPPGADAARTEGVTPGQVWGYYRLEPAFAAALDEAGEALCEDSTDYRCGSARGYGALRCRGTGCRVAKRAGR